MLKFLRWIDRKIFRNCRGGSKHYTDFIEVIVEDDELDEGDDFKGTCLWVRVAADYHYSFLKFELAQDGVPMGWRKELREAGSGFYRVTYSHYTDGEYEDGYQLSSYEVLDDIIELKKDWRARPAFFLYESLVKLGNLIFYATSPAKKQWVVVQKTSETSAFLTRELWLWQAAWLTLLRTLGFKRSSVFHSKGNTYHLRHSYHT